MEASNIGWKVNRPKEIEMLTMWWFLNSNCEFPIVITHSCVTQEGWMDGGWTGKIFPLGSNSVANHGAWMLFFTFLHPNKPLAVIYRLTIYMHLLGTS